MAPVAISEPIAALPSVAELKSAATNRQFQAHKGVSDDFMYAFKYDTSLPTLENLGTDFDTDADVNALVSKFVDQEFAPALKSSNADQFASLFIDSGVWRDKVSFTWEYRTFNGREKILSAATDLLPKTPVSEVKLITPAPSLEKPYDDLHFAQAHLSITTDKVTASAVVNFVFTRQGLKIWTLHTAIEGLNGFPELPNRDGHMVGDVSWTRQREIDTDFEGTEPEVVIIGGGHNGLMMAARLKALGVPALMIERNARIGDNWRQRYEALSLHFPHWADHFPYMPYPEHWPVYTPAAKLGDYLEWYCSAMELHAWCSSSVTHAEQKADGSFTLEIDRGAKGKRILHPKQLVMATSLAGVPMTPVIPGSDKFKGTLRHSTEHDSSRAWVGKKVLVVGTSSSGFDTAYDFARRGIDVTILQRGATYIMSLTNSVPRMLGAYMPKEGKRPDLDVADRLAYSMPVGPGEELGRRMCDELVALDQPLLEGMEARGFKTWKGQRGTGVQTLGYTKNGGFYFDAGACKHIIDGSIKVEQGWIDHFTEDKVYLNGDREREYDLVVFATGFSNTIDSVRRTLGDEIANRVKPIWGMDEEGELNSAWKDCGVPNFWIMVGTLQHGRYHSKKVALRIKALLEGIAGESYKK
ncbi:flavin-containing monooxygenase [Kwoniella heveanensis CBS 569]|uniref:Flavin-containing monooxygenase n=1 Tax=Kwoniella heveanensis BCC8398 TaxID=1296120 RepID=A0A1B9GIN5_9TREE|nr:flavin-containing monooxygenase [Kwoniella heveanensis BCC8398]OCF41151.1 flavin-containing monooxygenase [Kwoniella heveanensis CBS 569]